MATKEARWVIGHRVSPVETDSDYAILQIVTPPQTPGPPPHFHDPETELFLILSGEMEVICDGRTQTLKAGESIVIPRGSVHTFRNATDKEVTWITAFSPSRFTQFFVDFGVPASIPGALQQSVSEAMIQRVVAGCSKYGMNLATMPALVGSENQIRAVDLAPNGDSADSCRVNEAVFGAGSRRD